MKTKAQDRDTCRWQNVSRVDAASQTLFVSGSGSKELPPTQNSPATRTWRTQVKKVKAKKDEGDQIGKMAATQPSDQLSTRRSGKESQDRRLTSLNPG